MSHADDLADQSPVDSGVTREIRKRGRPSKIPAERKEEVAKLMADAAARGEKFSRKEAAKILYTTDKPTASQRRNAGNIMKYYLKSRDKN
jgi:truncated hemoglobin YjbI